MRRGTKFHVRLLKAEEAMLAAVSIYNNPLISFKTEASIELVITAWIYLLQAYCTDIGIEIRIRDSKTKRVRYERSGDGSYRTLPFPDLVAACSGILSPGMSNNLLFINGIRRGVQHSVDNQVDGFIAPKIQANILNFNKIMLQVSDGKIDVSSKLPLALQFAEMSFDQATHLIAAKHMTPELQTFILEFEHGLSDAERNDTAYEAHVRFHVENKNRGSDLYNIAIVKPGEEIPEGSSTVALKEVEKPKYLPGQVVSMMKAEGFTDFNVTKHTEIWKLLDARNESKGYGKWVAEKQWYWYEKWIDEVVRPYCEDGYSMNQ